MTKEEYVALASFRYALRQFQHQSERRAREANVTGQQYLALLQIKGFPEREHVTISELSERLQIEHHSTVGLVDRLVALDLVRRQQAKQDKRYVFVALTAHGDEVLSRLASANRNQLRLLQPQLHLIERLAQAARMENPDGPGKHRQGQGEDL